LTSGCNLTVFQAVTRNPIHTLFRRKLPWLDHTTTGNSKTSKCTACSDHANTLDSLTPSTKAFHCPFFPFFLLLSFSSLSVSVLSTYADGQSGVSIPLIHPFARINVRVTQRLNDETALVLETIDLSGQGPRKMPSSTQPIIPPPAVPPGSGQLELLPIQETETPSVVFNETCSQISLSKAGQGLGGSTPFKPCG